VAVPIGTAPFAAGSRWIAQGPARALVPDPAPHRRDAVIPAIFRRFPFDCVTLGADPPGAAPGWHVFCSPCPKRTVSGGSMEARWDALGSAEDGGWNGADEVFPDSSGFGSLVCALSAATEDEWTLDQQIRDFIEALSLEN
jgi:hypothetical protein